MTLVLKSSAFNPGGPIPAKYTSEGENISPPLSWEGVPERTQSLALIVTDPDAPDPVAPRTTWVHWVLFNIPPDVASLAEGTHGLPKDAKQGLNDWQRMGYGGPAPPIGRHRYYFRLYALKVPLKHIKDPTRKGIETAMKSHIVAQAELVGTYMKAKHVTRAWGPQISGGTHS